MLDAGGGGRKSSAAAAGRAAAGQKPAEDGWAEEPPAGPCGAGKLRHVPVSVRRMTSLFPNFPLLALGDDLRTPALRRGDALCPEGCAGSSGTN